MGEVGSTSSADHNPLWNTKTLCMLQKDLKQIRANPTRGNAKSFKLIKERRPNKAKYKYINDGDDQE